MQLPPYLQKLIDECKYTTLDGIYALGIHDAYKAMMEQKDEPWEHIALLLKIRALELKVEELENKNVNIPTAEEYFATYKNSEDTHE